MRVRQILRETEFPCLSSFRHERKRGRLEGADGVFELETREWTEVAAQIDFFLNDSSERVRMFVYGGTIRWSKSERDTRNPNDETRTNGARKKRIFFDES